MKKIISGKIYDTETADLIHEWWNGRSISDFNHRSKSLYRTKKGTWFIHHIGGAMTDMQIPAGSNSFTGSESIEPVTEEEVIEFLETHDGDEKLMELFGNIIEEA